MPRPPKRRGRAVLFSFASGEFQYDVRRVLVSHPDFDTLWLANRKPLRGGPARPVVLKEVVLSPSSNGFARVMEEVRLVQALRHPNISTVHGFATEGDKAYVVMEYLSGCFLGSAMDAAVLLERTLSPAFAAYVASEVADALDYAHRCEDEDGRPLQLVHRGVSPVRIRLGPEGRVKLTDFGAASADSFGRIPTPPDVLRGDPAYVAPEILRGFVASPQASGLPLHLRGVDGRADIFSLGLVLLEMLTACHPLDAPSELWKDVPARFPPHVRSERPTFIELATLANRVLHFGPEQVERAVEEVPVPLQHTIARALAAEPAERHATAGQMRDELRAYLRNLEKPHGAREAEAELSGLLKEASDEALLVVASGMERGVLPTPVDGTLGGTP